MTSQINANFPVYGIPTTSTVRQNFSYAKAEIEALQLNSSTAINVKAFGAVGDGIADDTASIRNAMIAGKGRTVYFPASTYKTSGSIFAYANTKIFGDGAGSILLATSAAFDPGPPSNCFFINEHYNAGIIADENISISDLSFSAISQGGQFHCVRFNYVDGIRIYSCIFTGGGDGTAFLGCNDTTVNRCSFFDQTNCCIDHWNAPRNGRVIDCYMNTSHNGMQPVNWNAKLDSNSVNLIADGFIMSGNIVEFTGTGTAPIVIWPLGEGGDGCIARNCVVANNIFKGHVSINGRALCQNIAIIGNTFYGVDIASAITFSDVGGARPSNITCIGNIIIDPKTSAPSLGVIDINGTDTAVIMNNTISGSSFGLGIYTVGNTNTIIDGNAFDDPIAIKNITGPGWRSTSEPRIMNNDSLQFYDTNGFLSRLRMQTDNNFFVVQVPNDTGAINRTILSYQAGTSASVPLFLPQNLIVGSSSDNHINLIGAITGTGVTIQASPNSLDVDVAMNILGKGTRGTRIGSFRAPGTPTITDIPDGRSAIWKNTTDGTVKLYVNDGNVLKSITLV